MDGMRQGGSPLVQAVQLFKAAAHPARLRILAMLRPGGLCVCQITAVLELAVSTVSAHLGDLKRAGLLDERKDGRWVRYRLADHDEVPELMAQVWRLTGKDAQVQADARLVRQLRRLPVEQLCRADLDLSRLGLKRPAARTPAGST